MQVKTVTESQFPEPRVYAPLMHPGGRPTQNKRTEIGERIAQARERRGISQYELADLLGVSQQSVAAWERRVSAIRSDSLIKLAKILEVSADELLGLKTPRNSGPSGKIRQVFDEVSKLPRRQQAKILDTVETLLAGQAAKAS